ncbi:hypothetical protein M9H77_18134 [Catharanthus roseus]|uniref:Uncharacterized protein n=1 Tax=Catharanthus roseus TaxID=4058 RepID=A0ACC0B6J4_CATRO|nr:hypothetical protein M9H77_18134 [Catharanthus roseus]
MPFVKRGLPLGFLHGYQEVICMVRGRGWLPFVFPPLHLSIIHNIQDYSTRSAPRSDAPYRCFLVKKDYYYREKELVCTRRQMIVLMWLVSHTMASSDDVDVSDSRVDPLEEGSSTAEGVAQSVYVDTAPYSAVGSAALWRARRGLKLSCLEIERSYGVWLINSGGSEAQLATEVLDMEFLVRASPEEHCQEARKYLTQPQLTNGRIRI